MSDEAKIVRVPFIGLSTALGVAFIVLKLCGVIHWSWWLVTLPLWLGWGIALAVALALLLIIGFGALIFGIAAFVLWLAAEFTPD